MQSKLSLSLRGTLGALVLHSMFLGSATAAPSRSIPSAVFSLESTSHQLVSTYEREVPRDRRGQATRGGAYFLQAVRNLDTASHTLRSNTESRSGVRQAQLNVASVRVRMDEALNASRGLRLSERTRGLLSQARSQVSSVENQQNSIYASAANKSDRYDDRDNDRRRDRDHDHDHDHDHDDRGRDKDRNGLPGILGKIFGN